MDLGDAGSMTEVDLNSVRLAINYPALAMATCGEALALARDHLPAERAAPLDLTSLARRYRPLAARARSLGDIENLLGELLGQMGTSHTYVKSSVSRSAISHAHEYSAWTRRRSRLTERLSGGTIAYLHVADTSRRSLLQAERWMLSHDSRAIILDLRYNDGGTYGAELAELFLRRPLARILKRGLPAYALPAGARDIALAVLVNRFTSSGGELTAALLRLHGKVTILGERTLGAGLGQAHVRTLLNGSQLWLPELTVEWPSELAEIENRGVEPDVQVPWALEWDREDRFIEQAVRILGRTTTQ